MQNNKMSFKNRIEKLEKLGEGSYGKVYKIYDHQRGQVLAMKKIKMSNDEEGLPPTTLREITLLREVSHPSIVHMFDLRYYFRERKLYLMFEYMDMDLRKFIDRRTLEKREVDVAQVKRIFHSIVDAVDYLHENNIMHRDLKPQNILINTQGDSIKIADFGLARHFNVPFRKYSKEIVTLWYRAPEIIMGYKSYGLGVDIWSLGCIFYELFFGRPIFQGDCQVQTLFLIFSRLGTPNETIWPGVSEVPDFKPEFPKFKRTGFEDLLRGKFDTLALDLLSHMLVLDPLKRLTCREIKQHPFFKP